MKDIKIIVRADDAGSTRGANAAIEKTVKAGIVKNVSIMAPCSYVADAAERLAKNKKICFGMHATLNAEWDKLKWRPVSLIGSNSGLVDENGWFLTSPEQFLETKPKIKVIISEYDAQLDKLTKAGFDIRYVDSHCFPEYAIPGLDEVVEEWSRKKGLLNHMYFYALPPGVEKVSSDFSHIRAFLKQIPSGQYFLLTHPAFLDEDSLLYGNNNESSHSIIKSRNQEARFFSNNMLKYILRIYGIKAIRYDEATALKRISVENIMDIFKGL